MAHRDNRTKLHLVRLEDRNAASDTLNAILGNLGVSSLFGSGPTDSGISAPPSLLSAVDQNYLSGSSSVATVPPSSIDPTILPPEPPLPIDPPIFTILAPDPITFPGDILPPILPPVTISPVGIQPPINPPGGTIAPPIDIQPPITPPGGTITPPIDIQPPIIPPDVIQPPNIPPAGDRALPSFVPDEPTFKHECTSCHQMIRLPRSALGNPFKCAGCGAVQVGGQ